MTWGVAPGWYGTGLRPLLPECMSTIRVRPALNVYEGQDVCRVQASAQLLRDGARHDLAL